MSRETQNILVLLIGLSTGLIAVKGTYLNFVKPALLPWLVVCSGYVMPCYAARWLCPAVGGLRPAVLAPISPNLYWGKQKLGVSGGHLMPVAMGDSMGH